MKTNLTLSDLHNIMQTLSTVHCRIDWTKVTTIETANKWHKKVANSIITGERKFRTTPLSISKLYSAMQAKHPELLSAILQNNKQ